MNPSLAQTETGTTLRGTPAQGLFGATLGFFIGFAAVALFGPTANKFKDVMHLTPVMVGFLVAMPSLSGSLLRIPFSAWVDTDGGRKPFLVLLGLSMAGMVGLALVTSFLYPARLTPELYPLLLVLGLLCGAGIATFSVGISQVSYWYPKSHQGSALATYGGLGNLAPGIFSFLIPLALGSIDLAGSYWAWFLFLLVGTLFYFLTGRNAWYFQLRTRGVSQAESQRMARDRGQEIFPSGNVKTSLALSARVWKTWALVAIYFTTFGGFLALTAWFPTYWKSFFAVSAVTAGGLTAAYSILTSLVRVGGGMLSDRIGGERTAILALGTMLVGAAVMTLSHAFALSVASALLMALGMGVSNAAVFKLVPQEVPHAVGGAAGWVGGLGAFGGFSIPPVLGVIVARQGSDGYAFGFIVFVMVSGLSLLLALILKQTDARAVRRNNAAAETNSLPVNYTK